jgi:serine O-acetyltransferase
MNLTISEKHKNIAYKAFKKMILNDYPYHLEINDLELDAIFSEVYSNVLSQHSRIKNKFFSDDGNGIIDFKFLDHYLIFCFRMANFIYKNYSNIELAEAIYYSSKIRTSTDLYYTTEIDDFFMPAHSIGSVMDSRSKYGKVFKIYNGVHIGPYDILDKDPKDWIHPKFGDGVTLLANSSVYGATEIGNNVIVSAKSLIINEIIPSNCIVIGSSPKLFVLPYNGDSLEIVSLEK